MQTIYSILYISLNPALNERISIGLVMANDFDSKFHYSKDKLSATRSLLADEHYYLIKSYLKSLADDVHKKIEANEMYADQLRKSDWLNEDYVSYLSRYANNLIQFSEPKSIDLPLDTSLFNKLFEKYVYPLNNNFDLDKPQYAGIDAQVRKKLYPKIQQRVNLDVSLDTSHFDNLFASIEVNFIGKNGMPVAGKSFDFEKKHFFLENDLSRFISLTKAIELSGQANGKYFVIGSEPRRENDKNFKLWDLIRQSDFLDFVDVREIDQIEEYLKAHDVRPFFEEININ